MCAAELEEHARARVHCALAPRRCFQPELRQQLPAVRHEPQITCLELVKTMPTSIRETHLALQRVLPPGMQTADGKAGIGISFAPDMEGYQIIQSMAPQGAAAACGQV